MKFYSKCFACVALLLIAAVLPASAGSIKYTNSTNVDANGVSSDGVTAGFTLTTGKTDTITSGTLTFTGVFNVAVNFSGSCNPGSTCTFYFSKNGDTGWYTINLKNMTASGYIWNGKSGKNSETGTFSDSFSVPEGGSRFGYLAPAGLVIFGGIFLSGFLRPRTGRQENV